MTLFDPLPSLRPEGEPVEPVMIEQVAECDYQAKPCGLCGKPKSNAVHRKKNEAEGKPFCPFGRKIGCARCGRPKGDPVHFGAPESFNYLAGRDPKIYRAKLDQWKAILRPLLEASGLPRPLAHVLVEGEVSFGHARDLDQGNHRVLIEKALGDALEDGGWLANDSWAHYEFGGYVRAEQPGVSAVRLVLFPTLPAVS